MIEVDTINFDFSLKNKDYIHFYAIHSFIHDHFFKFLFYLTMYILNVLSILNILILLLTTKLIEKIPDPKEYHLTFYKNENKNNDETITNKYSTTKSFRKLKYY